MPRFEPHPERRPAVVTGASSGIGEASAVALATAGHPIVLGARRVELCAATAAAICAEGGEAIAVPLDVADPGSVDAFVTAASDAFGPVEILVSNAGEVFLATGVGSDADAFARQLEVNLLGAQRLVSLIAPGMVDRGRGDIVFVTSDVVRSPRPRMASYVTAKWGLEGLARAMQMELEGSGVRMSIVRPGPTLTAQGTGWDPAEVTGVLEEWGRWGFMRHAGYLRPADVAAAVLTVVATPRGTHLTLVEVQPEAPSDTAVEVAPVEPDPAAGAHLRLLDGGVADDAPRPDVGEAGP